MHIELVTSSSYDVYSECMSAEVNRMLDYIDDDTLRYPDGAVLQPYDEGYKTFNNLND